MYRLAVCVKSATCLVRAWYKHAMRPILILVLLQILSASAVRRRYCQGCKKHRTAPSASHFWYGSLDHSFHFCKVCYTRYLRRGDTVCHPSWSVFAEHRHDRDATGSMIYCSRARVDVCAFEQCGGLLLGSDCSRLDACMIFGLAYHMYWTAPMIGFVTLVLASCDYTVKSYRKLVGQVAKMYSGYRYVDGSLVRTTRRIGLSPLRNPSERVADLQYVYFCMRHPAQFRCLCEHVLTYFTALGPRPASIAQLHQVLGNHGFGVFSGRIGYSSLRFCRTFIFYFGSQHADEPDDWVLLSRMSGEVRQKLTAWGLLEYAAAMSFRNGMRQLMGMGDYSFLDLIIYVCLLKV